jgi:hypothetical protein
MLRSEEYDSPGASVVTAESLEALAAGMGVDPAFPITCGITFTRGGLRADVHGRVLHESAARYGGCSSAGKCSVVCSAATTRAALARSVMPEAEVFVLTTLGRYRSERAESRLS